MKCKRSCPAINSSWFARLRVIEKPAGYSVSGPSFSNSFRNSMNSAGRKPARPFRKVSSAEIDLVGLFGNFQTGALLTISLVGTLDGARQIARDEV
jgi:hypothetical protein